MFNIRHLLYIIPFSVECTLPNWVCCIFVFASIFSYIAGMIALLWLFAFLSEIRVNAARKFFADKMDPDRPRNVMYLKKNPKSWLTEFINFTGLYGLQECIKQSY